MTPTFDPYRALGLRRDATDADVKAAHRKLAKRFHPDAQSGDRDRFLRVQEAYRVLSDPLLRREWDARHAPGPLRADPVVPQRRPRTERRQGREPEQTPPPAADTADDATRRPRSSRAYTWSASEVPWWEEGASENRRQPGRKRPARSGMPGAAPGRRTAGDGSRPAGPTGPSGPSPEADASNPFDVYNRSSGAAWSMAARAYFRRGEQDLPRRGTFQYQGTQVVTGARARAAADAEARRRRAAGSAPPPQADAPHSRATPGAPERPAQRPAANDASTNAPPFRYSMAGVTSDARRIHEVRERWRRRTSAASWPSLPERLLYALVAWIPAAVLIGYGGAAVTGCATARPGCPAYVETGQAIAIAIVLGLLVALPKVAYVGAVASVGALFVGLGVVAVMALFGVDVPLSLEMTVGLLVALAAGYVITAASVVLRAPPNRPWYSEPQP